MIEGNMDIVMSASVQIRNQNDKMRDAFRIVTKEIRAMDENWNGSASQNAMKAFYKIDRYTVPNYETVNNYADALKSIAIGYTNTEKANTALANLFR